MGHLGALKFTMIDLVAAPPVSRVSSFLQEFLRNFGRKIQP